MSKESSPLLVIGWQTNDVTSLTDELYPIARKFEIEHNTDDLPNILCEDYSHIFTKKMSKELKEYCSENEIEIVAGADGDESGSWYFGFGIPYIQDDSVTEFLNTVNELSNVLKKSVEGIELSEPKLYNVISWF